MGEKYLKSLQTNWPGNLEETVKIKCENKKNDKKQNGCRQLINQSIEQSYEHRAQL